jgi:hypothetical protein
MLDMPLPVVGNLIGCLLGMLVGGGLAWLLTLNSPFDVFCLVSACLLACQLTGAGIGVFASRR